MRALRTVLLLLALAVAGGPLLTGCKSVQDAWETVRDTVD